MGTACISEKGAESLKPSIHMVMLLDFSTFTSYSHGYVA